MKQDVTFIIRGAEVKPEIHMPVTANIEELKQKIEDYTGIEITRQTLWSGTLELNDLTIIDHYNFKGTVPLRLQVQPLPSHESVLIKVLASELRLELEYSVKESDTVLDLKRRIEGSWESIRQDKGLDGVPEDMALWHLGVEMKNDQPLSKYYIHHFSVINLGTSTIC